LQKRTAQKYLNFTQSSLEEVRGEKLSIREVATLYGVPRSTLQRRLANPGRALFLSQDTGDIIVDRIKTMSNWSSPFVLSALDCIFWCRTF